MKSHLDWACVCVYGVYASFQRRDYHTLLYFKGMYDRFIHSFQMLYERVIVVMRVVACMPEQIIKNMEDV